MQQLITYGGNSKKSSNLSTQTKQSGIMYVVSYGKFSVEWCSSHIKAFKMPLLN